MRGVRNCINFTYSEVMYRLGMKFKSTNPEVFKEISLEDREFKGEKIFRICKKGWLIKSEITD